jgi:hypothetical protein
VVVAAVTDRDAPERLAVLVHHLSRQDLPAGVEHDLPPNRRFIVESDEFRQR